MRVDKERQSSVYDTKNTEYRIECVIFLYFFQAWNRTGSGLATLVAASLVSIYGI